MGLNYLKIVLCFAPFFMLNYTFTAFVRNDDACNIAMMATLISGIFNIVFDYIFIFPMKMGMTGAALATALAPLVSMLVCLVHYLSSKNTVKLVIAKVSLKKLLMSCNLGIVAFISEISSGITTMVFNYILLNMGIAHQRRNKFVCSQFVAQTLQEAGALELPDHPSLVRPEDFAYLEPLRVVYQGPLAWAGRVGRRAMAA